ncbi:hypothetical protein BDB01DRAFT_832897 [Pilobolus umbonatus]|nr:hypothetical protein BDB01DRAFT_832897 [Pilobolus umbonatus]
MIFWISTGHGSILLFLHLFLVPETYRIDFQWESEEKGDQGKVIQPEMFETNTSSIPRKTAGKDEMESIQNLVDVSLLQVAGLLIPLNVLLFDWSISIGLSVCVATFSFTVLYIEASQAGSSYLAFAIPEDNTSVVGACGFLRLASASVLKILTSFIYTK